MRLVSDVEVQNGKAHAVKHGLPRLLAGLPAEQQSALVRGDIAFGNEGTMAEMETLGQAYLFKLRQTIGQTLDQAAVVPARLAGGQSVL